VQRNRVLQASSSTPFSGGPLQIGAKLSGDKLYRYRLWRRWAVGPACCFIMLNPSTADAVTDDSTISRCQTRARQLGFAALEVVNLFALRSVDPQRLYRHRDPVGPENDATLLSVALSSELVVCGWGTHGLLHNRGTEVLDLFTIFGIKTYALKLNHDGTPAHPLYLPYSLKPREFP
jgi:hypothetical protein